MHLDLARTDWHGQRCAERTYKWPDYRHNPVLIKVICQPREDWCAYEFSTSSHYMNIIQKRPLVCSQFWLSVRNSVRSPFDIHSRGNPSLCWLGRAGV